MNSLQALREFVGDVTSDPHTLSVTAGALILATVFGAAAVGKLRALDAFADALVDFGVLQHPSRLAAAAVAGAEATIAVMLVVPVTTAFAASVAAAAAAVFAILVARSLSRGLTFACNCFGAGEAPISSRTLVRNLVLLAGSALVCAWAWQQPAASLISSDGIAAGVIAASCIGSAAVLHNMPLLFGLNLTWGRRYRMTLVDYR